MTGRPPTYCRPRGFLVISRPKINQFQILKLLLVRLTKLDSAYLVTYKPIVDDLWDKLGSARIFATWTWQFWAKFVDLKKFFLG